MDLLILFLLAAVGIGWAHIERRRDERDIRARQRRQGYPRKGQT